MIAKLSFGYRKLLSYVLTVLGFSSTFVFESCYGPIPNYDVGVSEDSLHFSAQGGEASVDIYASTTWEIARIPDYVYVDPKSGRDEAEVMIKVEANTTAVERCDTLYIMAPDPACYIIVTQDAAVE